MKGITFARILLDLSLEEFAKKVGISKEIISSWENDKEPISEEHKKNIEKILCINKDYIEKELTSVDKVMVIAEMEERKIKDNIFEDITELTNILKDVSNTETEKCRDILENIHILKLLLEFNELINNTIKMKNRTLKESYTELLHTLNHFIKEVNSDVIVYKRISEIKELEKVGEKI